MSGPKCASYHVEENLALEQLVRAQAWEVASTLEAQLARVESHAKAVVERLGLSELPAPDRAGRPDQSAPSSIIETYITALRNSIARLEEELRRAVAANEVALMIAAIADSGTKRVRSAAEVLAQRPRDAQVSPAQSVALVDIKTRRTRIGAILNRLSPLVHDAAAKAIRSLAAEVVEMVEPPSRFEGLEMELRRRIQLANEAARRAHSDAERAACLLARLRGLKGPEIDRVSAELAAVERRQRPLGREIEEQVQVAERAARKQADHDYAAQVVREELRCLGYEVEEGFTTLFVSGGSARVHKPAFREYALEMKVLPFDGRMDVRVVREGGTNEPQSQERRLRDREMEEAWCGDFSRLLAAIGKRRIAGRVVQRVRPGTTPVPIVAPTTVTEPARRRAQPSISIGQR